MNIEPLTSQTFHPMSGMHNPHLQTLLPQLIRRHLRLKPVWQTLDMPDGDFVDLAWSEDPLSAKHKPRVVLFHGLEGSFHSPYAHGLLAACQRRGWLAMVMHFRGCSGKPNRMKRIYHSGETEDASYLLRWMHETLGEAPTAAVGVSLGGNMLAYLLGQQGAQCSLAAAVIVSAPLMLAPCSQRIDQGFSRIYQHYLVHLLKQNASRKIAAYPDTLPILLPQLKKIRRLREFDDLITARIHGFLNAADYYQRCSAMPLLPQICKPLLIIQAKDDPFMTQDVIPDLALLPPNIEYQLTDHGGHVGFVGGSLLNPEMWLEQRIPDWLTPFLDQ
ncbi:hydrolase [Prodigiosinella aquatilis]|nr:hydrolase [Prodigiosinella sp. LS101]WJV53586.1 hydrolase [Prodigiosinella sp. LS101]WJV57945.1 hydrolase [Pectobacteriaceae bacterium C111]